MERGTETDIHGDGAVAVAAAVIPIFIPARVAGLNPFDGIDEERLVFASFGVFQNLISHEIPKNKHPFLHFFTLFPRRKAQRTGKLLLRQKGNERLIFVRFPPLLAVWIIFYNIIMT